MKKTITLFVVMLPHIILAQKSFTEADFKAMNARYLKNPVAFMQNETTPNFVYTGTDGIVRDKVASLKIYDVLEEISRDYSNIKVQQNGAGAVVTSQMKHTVIIKPTGQKRIDDEVLTATLVNQNGKWLLQSAVHSMAPVDINSEEAAIKKVIEGQTQASYDRDLEKSLSYWANVPNASYVLTSLNANLTGFEQIKNTYTYFMKANPTPDKSKIEASYKSITIKGNTAFVKHEEAFTNEKGNTTKQNCHRYLEKINTEWKLVGSVVTPMPTIKTDDEVAIKKVIEAETQSYLDGHPEKITDYWSRKPSDEFQSQQIVAWIGQPYAKAETLNKLNEAAKNLVKKKDIKIEREDFEIRINKDMAWATYTQKAIANGTVAQTIRETRILERIGGEWKIVYVGEQGVK
ncbi:nuclear transport factor 2 family protein [Lacihabitans soyangensis]|nr:nuclear transport factor 2 family protein [Lacihabitans soyangensis]